MSTTPTNTPTVQDLSQACLMADAIAAAAQSLAEIANLAHPTSPVTLNLERDRDMNTNLPYATAQFHHLTTGHALELLHTLTTEPDQGKYVAQLVLPSPFAETDNVQHVPDRLLDSYPQTVVLARSSRLSECLQIAETWLTEQLYQARPMNY